MNSRYKKGLLLLASLLAVLLISKYVFRRRCDPRLLKLRPPAPTAWPSIISKGDTTSEQEGLHNWEHISSEGRSTYLFSAFYDGRASAPVIRVLGLKRFDDDCPMYCCIINEGTSVSFAGEATVVKINKYAAPEHYIEYYYECKIPEVEFLPHARVSLTQSAFTCPLRGSLHIENLPMEPLSARHNIALCMGPIFRVANPLLLFEAIESNLFLGVDFITVYNHSISPRLDNLLQEYVTLGKVSVIQWTVPRDLLLGSHYYGQNLLLNDCLNRHMGIAKYVVVTDMDELIVPNEANNLTDMLQALEATFDGAGAYLFRHSSFTLPPSTTHPHLPLGESKIPWPSLLSHLSGQEIPHKSKIRSKVIMKPKRVEKVGVHEVFSLIGWFKQIVVPPETALLHHFSSRPLTEDDTIRLVRDERSLRFKEKFLKVYSDRFLSFKAKGVL